jgi:hypothetical protein
MIDTYTSSDGEVTPIVEMANPHLIHSIAKLAAKNATELDDQGQPAPEKVELLKALKAEAIKRLSTPKE